MVTKVQAGPLMGAPKTSQPNEMHNYLGAHKQSFPTGYVRSSGNLASKDRATQGVVGADVAKGKASY